MLARASVRKAIDDHYREQELEARDEAHRDLELDLVLMGELPLGHAMHLTAAERAWLTGSHYAEDDRYELDDEDFIAAERAAIEDALIDDSWYDRYGGYDVHETHGVPRLSEMGPQTSAETHHSYRE
jgi:hypothetical protein